MEEEEICEMKKATMLFMQIYECGHLCEYHTRRKALIQLPPGQMNDRACQMLNYSHRVRKKSQEELASLPEVGADKQ